MAARERHERGVDDEPALGDGRVEQLGLARAERVQEPHRLDRCRLAAAAREAGDQADERDEPHRRTVRVIDALVRSMTGFGRGVAEQGGVRATVDLRASTTGSSTSSCAAPRSRRRSRISCRRGCARASSAAAVAVSVNLVRAGGVRPGPHRSTRRRTARTRRSSRLAAALRIAPPDLALVLAQPGVVQPIGEDLDEDAAAATDAAILAALDQALGQLARDARRRGRRARTRAGRAPRRARAAARGDREPRRRR